jgi:hypothetical protein
LLSVFGTYFPTGAIPIISIIARVFRVQSNYLMERLRNLKVADKRGFVNPWMEYIFRDPEYSILGENFLITAIMTLHEWFLVVATKKKKTL